MSAVRVVVLGVVVTLVTGGCGSSRPSATAPAPGASAAQASVRESDLRFATCMRAHGILDFPDPNSRGVFPPDEVQSLKSSPQAKAAYAHCRGDLPSGSGPLPNATARADVVKFAECMRAHGVPDFPDPGSATTTSSGGLDPNSPQFKRAAADCKSLLAALARPHAAVAVP